MDEALEEEADEEEKRKRGEADEGDGRRSSTGGRRKDGGEWWLAAWLPRSRAWVEQCLHYFLHMVGHGRVTHGRSGGSGLGAVVAVFMRMLYLAIQSSYGRSDTGFEHSWRGAAGRRGWSEWRAHGWRVRRRGTRRGSEEEGRTPAIGEESDAVTEGDRDDDGAVPVCLGAWEERAGDTEGRQFVHPTTTQHTPHDTQRHTRTVRTGG